MLLNWLNRSLVLRRKDCIRSTQILLNADFLGEYATRYGLVEAKRRVLEMIRVLKLELKKLIANSSWIRDASKQEALTKVESMHFFVSHPDEYLDESLIDSIYKDVDFESYSKSFEALQNLLNKVNSNSILSSVDNGSSLTSAMTANAFYFKFSNSIKINAAILNYPIYDRARSASFNFAALGWIVAHEMGHAFDSSNIGRDRVGNIRNWWDKQSEIGYQNRSTCIRNQYDGRKLNNYANISLNGNSTLDENIADQIGFKLMEKVFDNHLQHWDLDINEKHELPADVVGVSNTRVKSLSSSHMFWLASASVLCSDSRPKALEHQLEITTHSLWAARTNFPLENSGEFSHTFGCSLGSPMNPSKKCEIFS